MQVGAGVMRKAGNLVTFPCFSAKTHMLLTQRRWTPASAGVTAITHGVIPMKIGIQWLFLTFNESSGDKHQRHWAPTYAGVTPSKFLGFFYFDEGVTRS